MKYYSLYPEENDAQGIAYAPEGVTFKLLYRKGTVVNWQAFEFTLRAGNFADYQWNNLGWHICSERLKVVLADCAGPDDNIQWLPVTVTKSMGESRDYYVLHLGTPCDVLSNTHTIMSGDIVVKPVLDASKVGTHNVFIFSGQNPKVYVTEDIRKRLRTTKITGLDFLKAPVVKSELDMPIIAPVVPRK